jgi:hypothetical protein
VLSVMGVGSGLGFRVPGPWGKPSGSSGSGGGISPGSSGVGGGRGVGDSGDGGGGASDIGDGGGGALAPEMVPLRRSVRVVVTTVVVVTFVTTVFIVST